MSLSDEIVDDIEERKRIVKHFKHYVNTYNEDCFLTEETFINDMIYGIGISFSEKNGWFPGFKKFKTKVSQILENYKILRIDVSWRQ